MKTADLIPFILLELNECDKYGFELTKAIESKSNGKIIIKQPTLYTLLKKLEKSKFIASYWQDSEIGGKRHYYKLTENGRLQVSTLPSYSFLLKNALNEENEGFNIAESVDTVSSNSSLSQEPKRVSIMDELLNSNDNNIQPEESVLPTNEVFAESNIDNSTELDLNLANSEILKDDKISNDEKFATNQDVMKFTEKVVSTPVFIANETRDNIISNDILDKTFSTPQNQQNIKYVDFVNIKKSESYQYSKKLTNTLMLKTLSTSATLIVLLVLCSLVTINTGRSALYYFMFITSLVVAIFYPIMYIANKDKIRIKYQTEKYTINYQRRILIGCIILLSIFVISIIVSIQQDCNSLFKILKFKNFSNFYAPLLFNIVYFLDLLYGYLLLKKINK